MENSSQIRVGALMLIAAASMIVISLMYRFTAWKGTMAPEEMRLYLFWVPAIIAFAAAAAILAIRPLVTRLLKGLGPAEESAPAILYVLKKTDRTLGVVGTAAMLVTLAYLVFFLPINGIR